MNSIIEANEEIIIEASEKPNNLSGILSEISKLSDAEKKMLVINLSLHELSHRDIMAKLEMLESKIDASESTKIIVIEEMDYLTAKETVEEFIKEHKTSDIAQLHEEIRIPIEQIIDIVDELIKEGKIREG